MNARACTSKTVGYLEKFTAANEINLTDWKGKVLLWQPVMNAMMKAIWRAQHTLSHSKSWNLKEESGKLQWMGALKELENFF